MSSMYPKAEEIFSEKESMIGILGKKTELEEYLPILKLFYREGENLFSDATIPAQYSVDGKEWNLDVDIIAYFSSCGHHYGDEV